VYEPSQIADAEAELISRWQAIRFPYGEGISFWALAQIVKAQAGIPETTARVSTLGIGRWRS
jgi:hypothetical protein